MNKFGGKALRFLLRIIPSNAVVFVLQGRLRGAKWIVGSGNHGCWLGSYEFDKQRIFGETVQPGCVVYDIGANVGFYSLLSARLVGNSGKVYSFEPLEQNLRYLRRHVDLNHLENVTVLPVAVSEKRGVCCFEEGLNTSMGHLSSQGNLTVPVVALDELLASGEIVAPDFLKIDVEGAELLVLLGARYILEVYHPTLFLATHGNEVHQQCCEFLMGLGYQLSPLTGSSLDITDEILAKGKGKVSQAIFQGASV
jgi:FkbM family methyltransferase